MYVLDLDRNQISDISALSALLWAGYLDLSFNQISDISALFSQSGWLGWLGATTVVLAGNPLSEEAIDVQIPSLEGRGAYVSLEPIDQPTYFYGY